MPNGLRLRIALDCRIDDHRQGAGSHILSLAHALSQHPTPAQEYTFIVHEDTTDWLAPHISGACRLVGIPRRKPSGIRQSLRLIPPLRALRQQIPWAAAAPVSDGYVESQNFDLVHFPTQTGYVTSLPTIYQPWDLQHRHYPQFFSPCDFAARENLYRALCAQAQFVCVQTQWSKNDIVDKYQIAPEKIAVIPWGSALDAYVQPSEAIVDAAVIKFDLPAQFFFYPAVTWPHKNHSVILRALERLKAAGNREVAVYFTGRSTPHRKNLDRLARELGVEGQVHYLGYVTAQELMAIFAKATAMVFPSKFEGFGLPILEAFSAHLPVLCARATVLPEVAQDAALYFDPDSPVELAAQMQRILDSPQVRAGLVARGGIIAAGSSMKDTAAAFRSLYGLIGSQAQRSEC